MLFKICLLLITLQTSFSIDFSALNQKEFEDIYLNKPISIPQQYKGIDLSFYERSSFSAETIAQFQKMTKVDWTKLYDFLIENPFLGGKDSNYLMAVYNFLR